MRSFIEVLTTRKMIRAAFKKAEEMGKLRNSITHGEGNIAGFVGEIIAQTVIGGTIVNTYDYDIVTEDGTKWDVKTKRCTSPPKYHYEASVANFNTQQDCDRYLFVRVLENLKKGWICGQLTKDEYYKKAKAMKKGDYDPRNDWYVKADCWNVEYSEMDEVEYRVH